MKPERKLALRRETLAELPVADLDRVVGGAPDSLLDMVCVDVSALLCPQSWHTEEC